MARNDALKSLHTDLLDTLNGYREAIADVTNPEVKSVLEKLRDMHQQAHAEIHAMLLAKGEQPDETGSFMSLVHKTVISVRSAITGLDRHSLRSFADGEQRLVVAYDAAIEEVADDTTSVETLSNQQSELIAMIDRMNRQST